jgi:large subunit ribosomal protein L3
MAKALLGQKLGMTQVFREDGSVTPVTVVQAGPCVVTQIRTPERDGYAAIQLGYGSARPRSVTKPEKGHFAKAGVEPARHLREVRTADAASFALGSTLTVEQFAAGELVDVIGVSKGKGFSGVMKRHNFAGLRDSHGTERKHRSAGSVGAGTTPGRVFKGMRMAGRLGNARTTVLSLEVVEVDPQRNLLLVKGAVPGPNGGIVMVRSAAKAPTAPKEAKEA